MGRAHALQMAEEHAVSLGVFGGGHRHALVVLGHARDDCSFLGTLSHARRHARNFGSAVARGWRRHCGYGISQDGWESIRSGLAAACEHHKALALANHVETLRRTHAPLSYSSPAIAPN